MEEPGSFKGAIWIGKLSWLDIILDPKIKKPDRVSEKANQKYEGALDRVMDFARLALVFYTSERLIEGRPTALRTF